MLCFTFAHGVACHSYQPLILRPGDGRRVSCCSKKLNLLPIVIQILRFLKGALLGIEKRRGHEMVQSSDQYFGSGTGDATLHRRDGCEADWPNLLGSLSADSRYLSGVCR